MQKMYSRASVDLLTCSLFCILSAVGSAAVKVQTENPSLKQQTYLGSASSSAGTFVPGTFLLSTLTAAFSLVSIYLLIE